MVGQAKPNADRRSPDLVMRLGRMGASFQTRLSFMQQLIRRMATENWRFERRLFDVDTKGHGRLVYTAHGPERSYSLVAFTRHVRPQERTDRVIAEVWDGTFSLFDGLPDAADIARLQDNTPRQEGGRFRPSELVLARANKSVRLFEHVVNALAAGRQPDITQLRDIGYLMRTTAVYGSGKFGCADREKIADRPEFKAPFQVEMLAVYLIRWLTIDLVNHTARCQGGDTAVNLNPDYARYLGIGNSTGLGMAPFLVKYPILTNNWVMVRETALARVRALPQATPAQRSAFEKVLDQAICHMAEWRVADATQSKRIARLQQDLADFQGWAQKNMDGPAPWDRAFRRAVSACSPEGQELILSLLLEPHGNLIDDLGETMGTTDTPQLQPAMPLGDLKNLITEHYRWALDIDFSEPKAQQRFWYYSEDKLEPRLGDRYAEFGADMEMPLAVGRDVSMLLQTLADWRADQPVADFLQAHPEYRHIIRRVQIAPAHPYGEVRDNLLAPDVRPIDALRFKLAFFGVSKFDPKSDLWTRVTMYQGAPLPEDLKEWKGQCWAFPVAPQAVAAP